MNQDREVGGFTVTASSTSLARQKLLLVAKKSLIWLVFLLLLYTLRHFFGLILLTFILSFIAHSTVERILSHTGTRRRRWIVTGVYLVLVALMAGLGYYIFPKLTREGQAFARGLPAHLGRLQDRVRSYRRSEGLRRDYPFLDPFLEYLEQNIPAGGPAAGAPAGASKTPNLHDAAGSFAPAQAPADRSAPRNLEPPIAPLDKPAAAAETPPSFDRLVELAKEHVPEIAGFLTSFVEGLLQAILYFLLSILFSFLIVLDLGILKQEVRKLRVTRLGFFYEETASTVVQFAVVLGRVFRAQVVIALVNTVLTLMGLYLLAIPSKFFLSIIVFFCSFIPVAGVFISSAPIILLAITDGGFMLALYGVVLIAVIHMIEAYVLNPWIMGAWMKINPVIILMILLVGHHFFGLWGMILGLPVFYYLFAYALQPANSAPGGKAATTK